MFKVESIKITNGNGVAIVREEKSITFGAALLTADERLQLDALCHRIEARIAAEHVAQGCEREGTAKG